MGLEPPARCLGKTTGSQILLETARPNRSPKRGCYNGIVHHQAKVYEKPMCFFIGSFETALENSLVVSQDLLKTPKSKFARVAQQAKDQARGDLEVEQLDEAPEIPREVGASCPETKQSIENHQCWQLGRLSLRYVWIEYEIHHPNLMPGISGLSPGRIATARN